MNGGAEIAMYGRRSSLDLSPSTSCALIAVSLLHYSRGWAMGWTNLDTLVFRAGFGTFGMCTLFAGRESFGDLRVGS